MPPDDPAVIQSSLRMTNELDQTAWQEWQIFDQRRRRSTGVKYGRCVEPLEMLPERRRHSLNFGFGHGETAGNENNNNSNDIIKSLLWIAGDTCELTVSSSGKE